MAEVIFFLAAIGVIAGAIGTVTLRNPFYSVLALVCHLIALAVLFLLLQAQFVAAAQVVVYAGAVMVLYVFVVAYVGAAETARLQIPVGSSQRAFALAFALALFVELCIAILGSGLRALGTNGADIPLVFGRPAQIGQQLLTKFLLPFEIASFLLLIAAVGAVVLARRRGGLHEEEQRVAAMDLLRPAGTGTMAEAVEGRTGTPEHRRLEPTTAGTLSAGEQRGGAEPEGGGW